MILNSHQHRVTRSKLSKLEAALTCAREANPEMDPRVFRAMEAGIQSQVDELQGQLQEYEELKRAKAIHLQEPRELGKLLIKARVARGLTQKDLASRLKLKPQQIQKWESTEYLSATLKRILAVMAALDVAFEADVPLELNTPVSMQSSTG
jgi:ribosome-binding protein aMBF1 (putative translation factor)